MSRWKLGPLGIFILGSLFFLMLLIVILPDVDLPDTAFHRGTAPMVVHSRATSAPAPVSVAPALQVHGVLGNVLAVSRPAELGAGFDPNFRPILLRSIRC